MSEGREEIAHPVDPVLYLNQHFQEINILKKFITNFHFSTTAGKNQSRASMVLFGTDVVPEFGLTNYENDPNADANLVTKIGSTAWLGGDTNAYGYLSETLYLPRISCAHL